MTHWTKLQLQELNSELGPSVKNILLYFMMIIFLPWIIFSSVFVLMISPVLNSYNRHSADTLDKHKLTLATAYSTEPSSSVGHFCSFSRKTSLYGPSIWRWVLTQTDRNKRLCRLISSIRHKNYSFSLVLVICVLPLLGEVMQVLFHSTVQRVKSFNVQCVQHLRLKDSEQNTVTG